MSIIYVTGSTGHTGELLVRRLSERGATVRALVRQRAKADKLAALPGVEIVEGDLAKPETLAAGLHGVDSAMLISSSDPTMETVQNHFVDAAKAAGVRHVVKLSGIIADVESPFRFGRMHGAIERHLEASGMAFTQLRAGEFMLAYFRQVPNIVNKRALLLPMADARIASFDVSDLADVAAHVLTTSGHEGKRYSLTGSESLSMSEVAATLSAAIGISIRYIDVPPEDAKAAQLAAGFPPFLADALAELFAERRKGNESHIHPDFEQLLGRKPTTFAEFATRNAAVFRGERPPT